MKIVKLVALLCLVACSVQAELSLEDLFEKYTYSPKGIKQMRSVGDGFYTTLDSKKGILLRKYADRNFEETLLDSLVVKGKKVPIFNYNLNEDRTKLLLFAHKEPIYRHSYRADCYLFDLKTKKIQQLSTKGKIQEPSFSPDGSKVAFVRENNLYYIDLQTKKETQITTDGVFTKIINGLPDWVYEEEFAFSKAYSWSLDGSQLAYLKFDESAVPTYTLFTYGNDETYPTPYTYKYPKSGATNATVGVWVYDLNATKNTELPVNKNANQYIPRIFWTKGANELLVLRLNRHQNKLEYLMANTKSGAVQNVYTETNKYYIDAENFDAITFLNATTFAYLSEQNGYTNLCKYDYKTKKQEHWGEAKWDITAFYGIDKNGNAYLQTAMDKPYNREIVKLTTEGKIMMLSKEKAYHTAQFDQDFTYWIDTYSTVTTPPIYEVKSVNGATNYVIEDNKKLKEEWAKLQLPQKEFIELPSAEQGLKLSAWRILPKNFDKTKKYPVLVTGYNGPNSQQVKNTFGVNWYDYLAQEGFIVYCVDTRGTAGRGEEFRKVTYLQLGKYESDDMIAVGKYLQSLPYVKANDLTIWGWSFGGFMSSLCLMKGQGVFKSAISVAPVTHWQFYDSVYTERYMRTPQENPEGYNANSPLGNYEKLKGQKYNYLLVHGTADDNVHIQNTYALTEKMVAQDIPFQMHIYTDKNHSIYGGKTRLHLYKKFMEFLNNRTVE